MQPTPPPQLKHAVLAIESALARIGDQGNVKQVLRLIVDLPALWGAIDDKSMQMAVAILLGSVAMKMTALQEQINAASRDNRGQDAGSQQPGV